MNFIFFLAVFYFTCSHFSVSSVYILQFIKVYRALAHGVRDWVLEE